MFLKLEREELKIMTDWLKTAKQKYKHCSVFMLYNYGQRGDNYPRTIMEIVRAGILTDVYTRQALAGFYNEILWAQYQF